MGSFKSLGTPTQTFTLSILVFDAMWDTVDAQDVSVLGDHFKFFSWVAPVSDDLTLQETNTTGNMGKVHEKHDSMEKSMEAQLHVRRKLN